MDPRYWLGCVHGTAVLVCSVSVEFEKTELVKYVFV